MIVLSNKVTVYSKPDCVNCVLTKNWLVGNDTDFESIDIFESEEAMNYVSQDLGFMGVPVTVIEGQEPFNGFRPDLLEKYLSK